MGCCAITFTYLLLFLGILTHSVSFLTPHIYENKAVRTNEGLFEKCVLGKCLWFKYQDFTYYPKWYQMVLCLCGISVATSGLFTIFALVNLISRSRGLHLIIGILLFLNAISISALVTAYTTANYGTIRFTDNVTAVRQMNLSQISNFLGEITSIYGVYSWSYWLLYATIAINALTALSFFVNQPTTFGTKFV